QAQGKPALAAAGHHRIRPAEHFEPARARHQITQKIEGGQRYVAARRNRRVEAVERRLPVHYPVLIRQARLDTIQSREVIEWIWYFVSHPSEFRSDHLGRARILREK